MRDDAQRVVTPFSGVKVYSTLDSINNRSTYTNADGSYVLEYTKQPCPGFSYNHSGYLIAEIPFTNFNPLSRATSLFGSDLLGGSTNRNVTTTMTTKAIAVAK